MSRLKDLLQAFRQIIGHEPNDLGEMEDDNGYSLKDDNVVAVVYVYKDGAVSWYGNFDDC